MSQFAGRGYQDAGRQAHPDVQRAIEDFRNMTPAQRAAAPPLLYWLLGEGTPVFKESKADSQYTDHSPYPNHTCANCIYAYRNITLGTYICSQIDGTIQPAGWCNRWRG